MLPILVTVLLTATVNASFYAAWMIANFVFVAPGALTMVLYAVGAADSSALARKTRFTLKLSLLAGGLACGVLLISAYQVLRLFGSVYAEQAGWSLRILALGVFPLIIKVHYVAICRVHGRVAGAALRMAAGGLLELVMAGIGAGLGGLPGLSVGWLAAVCVQAALTAPTVYKTATNVDAPSGHQVFQLR
jgi:Na+-driven multidrug efflux pump